MKKPLKNLITSLTGILAVLLLIIGSPAPQPEIPENPPVESTEEMEPYYYNENPEES